MKFYFPEGEIDFIASAPLTRAPAIVETVLGSKVRVQTSAEIIARKLRFRGAEFTARDIFDFAVVAEMEPGAMHRIAPILRECRQAVLSRLLSGDAILRRTFAQLEALEVSTRSYRECVAILEGSAPKRLRFPALLLRPAPRRCATAVNRTRASPGAGSASRS